MTQASKSPSYLRLRMTMISECKCGSKYCLSCESKRLLPCGHAALGNCRPFVALKSNPCSICDKERRSVRCQKARIASKMLAARRRTKARQGGQTTVWQWEMMLALAKHRCLCCRQLKALVFDHIIPVCKGGRSDIFNGQPLCAKCNSIKHAKTIDYRTRPIMSWLFQLQECNKLKGLRKHAGLCIIK